MLCSQNYIHHFQTFQISRCLTYFNMEEWSSMCLPLPWPWPGHFWFGDGFLQGFSGSFLLLESADVTWDPGTEKRRGPDFFCRFFLTGRNITEQEPHRITNFWLNCEKLYIYVYILEVVTNVWLKNMSGDWGEVSLQKKKVNFFHGNQPWKNIMGFTLWKFVTVRDGLCKGKPRPRNSEL